MDHESFIRRVYGIDADKYMSKVGFAVKKAVYELDIELLEENYEKASAMYDIVHGDDEEMEYEALILEIRERLERKQNKLKKLTGECK